jgi:protein transport protein SEC20
MRSKETAETRMRRTKAMLAQELERSAATLGVIEDSSRTTRDVLSTHEALGGHIAVSRGLVSRIRAHVTRDRLLLYAAVFFFVLCVLWVLWSRI